MSKQCALVFLICIVCTLIFSSYGWTSGFISEEYPGRAVQYVYYTNKQTWNEARDVCLSIGGDLAKINSRHVMDAIIQLAEEAYPGESILSPDCWIGLYDTSSGFRQWLMDCSPLDYTSNFVEVYDDNERCFKIRPDVDYIGTSRQCGEDSPFLCEIHPARTCPYTYMLHGEDALSVPASSLDTCEQHCTSDSTCAGALYVSPSVCYKLPMNNTVNGSSSALATVGSKFCGEFVKNVSVPNPDTNNDKFPNETCGAVTIAPLETTTPSVPSSTILSSSFSPTPTVVCPSSFISLTATTEITTICSTMVMTELVSSTCPLCSVPTATLTQTQLSTVKVQVTQTCTPIIQVSTATIVATPSCILPSSSPTPPSNVSLQDVMNIANEYSKNLTVNAKKTSSYLRKLTSAPDFRKTSTAMGTVGIVCIVVPLTIILSSDIRKLYRSFVGRNRRIE